MYEEVRELSAAELAVYPLGIARLDAEGTVLLFNHAEERFANRSAADTLGKKYFRDVAPCAAVKDFEGRFREFLTSSAEPSIAFSFFYPFSFGHKQVFITLVRASAEPQGVFVVTEILPSNR